MEAAQFMSLIVERRKSLGITQEMLAKAAGTDQARVSAYERGENEPGIAIALRLITAVSLDLTLTPFNELD